MTVLHLIGRVTDAHELEVELPESVPSGQVRVTVEIPLPGAVENEERTDTTPVEPMSGAEIIRAGLGGEWADQVMEDGQKWLEESRQRRRAARQK